MIKINSKTAAAMIMGTKIGDDIIDYFFILEFCGKNTVFFDITRLAFGQVML
jgi:hypothetical protein